MLCMEIKQIDAKDRRIIRELQQNGRLTNLELAERVNLSPSPCLRRVRMLEEASVIVGYSADIDRRACGFQIMAFIRITLQRHERDVVEHFEKRIREVDEILECFLLTGEADYLLRVIVADLDDYEHFVRNRLQGIPGIASIATSLVYGTIKSSRLFPLNGQ